MEIQIENLKAKMRGVELNSYQKGLALDEFEMIVAHTEALEQQLRQYNVSGSLLPLDVHKKARELSAGEFIDWWFAKSKDR